MVMYLHLFIDGTLDISSLSGKIPAVTYYTFCMHDLLQYVGIPPSLFTDLYKFHD